MTRRDLTAEHGITMIAVMLVMLVATVISSAALLAAQGDLPFAGASQDRKQAYGAAEAGTEYYLYQLTQDNDYWTKCASVPAPAPVNQKWNGVGADPRTFRTLPGTKAEYAIELIPNSTSSTCTVGSADSTMLDPATGTFKVRTTGRTGDTTRSIITSFRRSSFLDFLYFTDYETLDPVAYTGGGTGVGSPGWATTNCSAWRQFRDDDCRNIQFITADANKGPFHTNDSVLACGGYTLGRKKADRIEISQTGGVAGVYNPGSSPQCNTGTPNILGTVFNPTDTLTLPTTNAALKAEAVKGGIVFNGTTTIVLKGNVMDVWNSSNVLTSNMALPANGVIYVDNVACPTIQSPLLQNYDEAAGCANVTVSGTYAKNLTIASRKDIIIGPRLDPTKGNRPSVSNGSINRSGDVVLGLIADNFVRVQHAVDRTDPTDLNSCTNRLAVSDNQPMFNVTIEAAILSLQHSFIADNYMCGNKLGTITAKGAIAQKFRGPVGLVGSTGFIKDYNYDDRLRYRSPPFFLDPVSAAWGVVRQNEQVPATK